MNKRQITINYYFFSSLTQLVNQKLKSIKMLFIHWFFFSVKFQKSLVQPTCYSTWGKIPFSPLLAAFPTDCGISNTSLTYLSSDQSTIIKSFLFRFSKELKWIILEDRRKKRCLNVFCFFQSWAILSSSLTTEMVLFISVFH